MEPTITLAQAAKRLGISYSTALRWHGRGWLNAHRLPSGRLIVRPEELARLLGGDVLGVTASDRPGQGGPDAS